MIIIPVYNALMLPDVNLYFKEDVFQKLAGKEANPGDKVILLFTKTAEDKNELTEDSFYPVGVKGLVTGEYANGYRVVRTESRIELDEIRVAPGGEISVEYHDRPDIGDMSAAEQGRHLEELRTALLEFVSTHEWGEMVKNYMMQYNSISEIAVALSGRLSISSVEKYDILAEDSIAKRTDLMEKAIYEYLELARISDEAETSQTRDHQKIYREQAIKKQMEYLQNELDEMHPENESDIRKYEKKIAESGMNETARAEAEKVLSRLKQEGKNSPEYGMLYDYLDFVTGLTWKAPERDEIDLKRAEEILEEDHFGLKKVKKRILQQIAVMNLLTRKEGLPWKKADPVEGEDDAGTVKDAGNTKDVRNAKDTKHAKDAGENASQMTPRRSAQTGSILLFVGAPGTGKTSIGQSIARALGRAYVRVSLGGVRDEAEIRGHRRTYIGAMPGRIMDGISKSKAADPVMVLDEVDKLAVSYNGDPASALLEVLDPEQNFSFTDHYMNVPYDLSNVVFICTANSVDTIPEPLLNRMEVIQFPGYTASDKLQIAKRHLLPKAREAMGIDEQVLEVGDDTIRTIISDYTMEGGVRGLKKRMDTLCREAAVRIVKEDEPLPVIVTPDNVRDFIDAKPIRHDHILEKKKPGIVTGLAWTAAGGEILFIETLLSKGHGNLKITGQLGDVMKESVQIALSLVKALFPEESKKLDKRDLHVHVPAGAVPKDGPSAGITLTTALASLVTEREVSPEIAMTGEISLRGVVMPIGGLPEKLMAAVRAGISKVLIPEENMDDLDEVPQEVRDQLTIVPVRTAEQVLRLTGILDPEQIENAREACFGSE